MVTIVVCNQKGGVGKTSVATNLIAGFDYHYPEKRKLAIDLDPQGHSTFILHEDPNKLFSKNQMRRRNVEKKRKRGKSTIQKSLLLVYSRTRLIQRMIFYIVQEIKT